MDKPVDIIRPYQTAALEAVRTRKVQRGLLALPTGTGKTFTASRLPGVLGTDRILVLAHREELIAQLYGAFASVLGHHAVGVERAEYRAHDTAPCVVASVPTLAAMGGRRLASFEPTRFDVVVVDEAHHATSESYLQVWRHFGLLDAQNQKVESPRVLLLGLTATPGRADGIGLSNVFDEILYQYKLIDAIKDGWLVPIEAFTCETQTDLSAVRTRAGEYVESDLAEAVNVEPRTDVIIDLWKKECAGLRTLVFCVNVEHAKSVADRWVKRGYLAQHIDGSMDSPARARILTWFRETPGAVLTNCAILAEGTDIPSIECIVSAAPTRSATRYAQQMGRGLRLAPGAHDIQESIARGKHRCVMLDVTDSTTRLAGRAVRIGDIFGLPLPGKALKGENLLDELEEQERERAASLMPAPDVRHVAKKVDIFALPGDPPRFAQLRWGVYEGEWQLSLGQGERMRLVEDMLGQWRGEWWDVATQVWSLGRRPPTKDLPRLVGEIEDWIYRTRGERWNLMARDAAWLQNPPTDKQLAMARALGINVPPGATKGYVSAAIDSVKRR